MQIIQLLGDSLALGLFLIAIWYILQVIALWRIFVMAGIPGWHSIIPVVNIYDQFKLSWSGTWGIAFIALALIGGYLSGNPDAQTAYNIVGAAAGVIEIVGLYKLSKAFGHGVAFTLGLIFLNPIFMLILGFSSNRYRGRQ